MSQSHTQGGSPPTSTMAIVALVLAFFCWPIGLILGIVALVKINDSKGALGGKGLAIAAIVIPLVFLPIGVLGAIAVPNFVKFQCRSKQSEAKVNLKALHVAEQMALAEKNAYSNDAAAIGFAPKGAKIRYTYRIIEAGPNSYRAEAVGIGEMAGDVWTIDQTGQPQNVTSACD